MKRAVICALVLLPASSATAQPTRPNIVWISNEDMSPHLGVDWMTRIGDQGLINEAEMIQRMWPGGVQPETASPTS